MFYELFYNKYILSNLRFPYFNFIRKFLFLVLLPFNHEGSGKSQKRISYNFFSRLWRIFKFLKRSRKKRKDLQKSQKQQRREERKKEKRFLRRKRRRKLKVVLKSLFKRKILSGEDRDKIKEARRLSEWKSRKRKRLAKAFFKGFFKRKSMSASRIAYLKRVKEEQEFNRYKRKRIFRFVLKKYRHNIIHFLSGKGLPKKRKKAKHPVIKQILKRDQLVISTHSLLLFILSYLFIEFFSNLSMGVTSLLFDYKTVIYYYKIEFLVDYDAWFADSIKTIFAAGPVVALIIAILSLIIYSLVYLETGILKTLLLWAIFHGSNKIIGGTLIGNLLGKGFGYVIMYLYYSDTGKLIMTLLMIMISVIIGTISTKYWIMSANSYYKFSKPSGRRLFMTSQVFIPYLLGVPIIWLINQPEVMRYNTLVNISMIFMILPPVLISHFYQEYYFEDKEKKITWSYRIILVSIILIAAYRILLGIGLRIG